ncbi:DoxX family membrane protein [Pedobacter petrophilus]|uniref:DoxX family membrane protein n=1 Tax=Pedobacter petrophilus TaxID=1908241 RepID=A0A7K0FTN0_9SPHI|nr:BT_3928 family protein [Pedobacter petrophilus]MRX74935.1 DoxX family membrane protein [Pedobacter petrophilus]
MRNILLSFSRFFVGALFIFSGLIKANDPLGFGYKLQEYFEVFHLNFLSPAATGIAILLCTLEIVLGALLILGFWSKKVAWGLLLLIIFFTLLTFISAAFKVVTSCGCFGDAIPLTPWQSFSKDLILLVLILIIFLNKNAIEPLFKKTSSQRNIALAVILVSLGFGLYTYNVLPVIDFLPYKVGAHIPSLMVIPPGEKPDEFEIMYHLKNKKTKEEKDMSDKDYLKTEIWKDNNWEIIGEPVKRLVKKGYEPKIKDLVISDASGTDYTKEIIENPYYSLVFVAYDLKNTNESAIGKLNAIAINATQQFNIRTVLLTSNAAQDAEVFVKKNNLFSEVFYADAVPLKSMVRANPGVLLLKNGVIVNKWHNHNVPTFDQLSRKYFDVQ